MKKCSYCGRENEDAAVVCSGCTTEIASPTSPEPDPHVDDAGYALVVVGQFDTMAQASLLLARLEAAGIEACIPEEYAPQVFSNVVPLGGVTVRVATKDLEAAKAIAAESSQVEPSHATQDILERDAETGAANIAPKEEKRRSTAMGGVAAIGVIVVCFVLLFLHYLHHFEAESLVRTGIAYSRNGDLGNAISNLSQAIRIDSSDARAYTYRGYVYARQNQIDKAVKDWNDAIRLNPRDASAYLDRGRAYGRKGELEKALADLDIGIRLAPQRLEGYALRGYAFLKKRDFDKAISDLDEALRLSPNDFRCYDDRGYAYQHKGQLDKAISDYSEAIHLAPTNVWSYGSRGRAYRAKGDFEKALADFNYALAIGPDDAKTCNALAWLLATCPIGSLRDGKRALALANRACELSDWKLWYCIGTLGAAYAEAGDFENAEKYQKQALTMTRLTDKDRAEAEKRIALYEQHQAYREDQSNESLSHEPVRFNHEQNGAGQ